MKKLFLISILFLIVSICKAENEFNSSGYVLINGDIMNPTGKNVEIGNYKSKVDEHGHFKLHFKIDQADYFTFKHSQSITLFLSPGDSLHIKFDNDNFLKSMNFKGKGKEVNNYLVKKSILETELIKSEELYSLGELDFISRTDSIRNILNNQLDQVLKKELYIDKKFIKFEKAKIIYSWAYQRLSYPEKHKEYTKKVSFSVGKDYDEYLNQIDFNDDAFLFMPFYMRFTNDYFYKSASELLDTDEAQKYTDNIFANIYLNNVLEKITNERLRNFWLYAGLRYQIDMFRINNTENLMAIFQKYCSDENYKKEINSLYEEVKSSQKYWIRKTFKTIDKLNLDLFIIYPPDSSDIQKRPAFVFFHGGGWLTGNPIGELDKCLYFASRGMVAISVQYRLKERNAATPLDAVSDAKSAICWIRDHANELHIDPDKIVASGFSAGAHLAACTGFIESHKSENSIPNALVLYSHPLIINEKDLYLHRLFWEKSFDIDDISPSKNIRKGLPPTIIFHGLEDDMLAYSDQKEFVDCVKKFDNQCDLYSLEGAGHFIFGETDDYIKIFSLTDSFLNTLGFISGKPNIEEMKKVRKLVFEN